MKAEDINKVERVLKALIHGAVVNSVHFVDKKCELLGSKPQEPDFIASLTLVFTPQLFDILKEIFPRKKFAVTGVYCHQKSLADIGLDKDPEIGDLLIAYIYTDEKGSRRLNSLLLQAKISRTLVTKVSASDEHQLKLYTDWPEFKYKRAGRLNGKVRDILPKTINDGAQYLIIDDDPVYGLSGMEGTFPMGCATPSKMLGVDQDIASELIDFLKFKSGRAFENNPSISRDDWTNMIWDILEATKAKASNRKNAGIKNFPRQVTRNFDGCCFFTAETNSIFSSLHRSLGNDDFSGSSDNFFDEENISPSVILIESGEEFGE